MCMVVCGVLFNGMHPVSMTMTTNKPITIHVYGRLWDFIWWYAPCKYDNDDKQTYNNPCVWLSVGFYLVVCTL